MRKVAALTALILGVLITLTGCARVRYPTYYTLNLPPAPDPPPQQNVAASIAVRDFQSPAYLRQGPIVYRVTPGQIGFYQYHRWAVDPRALVTGSVIDHLRAGGNYSFVSKYDGHSTDYILSGKLEKLEEVDDQAGVKVEIAMSAQITCVATGAIAWSNAVSEVATVSKRNVPELVAQMNRTTELAVNQLLATVPAVASSAH